MLKAMKAMAYVISFLRFGLFFERFADFNQAIVTGKCMANMAT